MDTLARCEENDLYARCFFAGLGIGVWAFGGNNTDTTVQTELLLEVIFDILIENQVDRIKELTFYFNYNILEKVSKKHNIITQTNVKPNLHKFTKKMDNGLEKIFYLRCNVENPSGKYEHPEDIYPKELTLFESYAWDGNSFPGNEYYFNKLSDSGDPAAICSCDAAYYHNAYANPNIDGKFAAIYGSDSLTPLAGGGNINISSKKKPVKTIKNIKYKSLKHRKTTRIASKKIKRTLINH
jgi:hypothetical protein